MSNRSTKRCPRCCPEGVELPASAFGPCRSRYDGLQSLCRECYQKAQREYHARDGRRRRASVRENSRRARERNRAELLAYLGQHPCVDCGNSDIRVLEFHHVGPKTRSVSNLALRGHSWERVEQEIAQCIVLCANCHRIREFEERGSFRSERRRSPKVSEPRPRFRYAVRFRATAAHHSVRFSPLATL